MYVCYVIYFSTVLDWANRLRLLLLKNDVCNDEYSRKFTMNCTFTQEESRLRRIKFHIIKNIEAENIGPFMFLYILDRILDIFDMFYSREDAIKNTSRKHCAQNICEYSFKHIIRRHCGPGLTTQLTSTFYNEDKTCDNVFFKY